MSKLSAKIPALLLSAALLAAPMAAQAAADLVNPAASGDSASANVNFRVIVAKVLFLGIGSGYNFFANNGLEEVVTWIIDPGSTPFGPQAAVSANSAGAGAVHVRVFGNGGDINIEASSDAGGLSNGLGQFIDFADIDTVSSAPGLPAPALVNGLSLPVTLPGSGAGSMIVDQSAVWTYSFNYSVPLANGDYTGTSIYTASLP